MPVTQVNLLLADSNLQTCKSCGITNLLIVDVFDQQWLDDVGDELRMDVGVPDLIMQQLLHRSLGLGTDLLWLVADIQLWNLLCKEKTRY